MFGSEEVSNFDSNGEGRYFSNSGDYLVPPGGVELDYEAF